MRKLSLSIPFLGSGSATPPAASVEPIEPVAPVEPVAVLAEQGEPAAAPAVPVVKAKAPDAMTEAELEARIRELASLAVDQDQASDRIRQPIAAAVVAHDAAVAARHVAMTLQALGEVDAAEVDAATDAVAQAAKALQDAREGQAEAEALSATAAGIRARMAPLEAELGERRRAEAARREAAMIAELRRRIDAYHRAGAALLRELAGVLALDEHLNSLGKPQHIAAGYARKTTVGLFGDHRGTADLNELMNDARRRVGSEFA